MDCRFSVVQSRTRTTTRTSTKYLRRVRRYHGQLVRHPRPGAVADPDRMFAGAIRLGGQLEPGSMEAARELKDMPIGLSAHENEPLAIELGCFAIGRPEEAGLDLPAVKMKRAAWADEA